MKAITFASIVSLALVGAACSETSPTPETSTAQTPVETVSEDTAVDSGFNLRIPGETGSEDLDTGEFSFNLRVPGEDSSDGFQLPDNIPTTTILNDVPDFKAPDLSESDMTNIDPDAIDDDVVIKID